MKTFFAVGAAALLTSYATDASAATCLGNCGAGSPNGDVTAPPEYGPNFSYISTWNGQSGAGQIAGIGGTTGSEYITDVFSASSGDALNFYFNYITSDGAGFSDYTFAQLLTSDMDPVAYLFSARTTPTGDTSPGFGLPANASTLDPATTPIQAGAPSWNQLGAYSGRCYSAGCGLTGWINSNYVIGASGDYVLRLGVTNFADSIWHSGLAFAGVTVGGVEVPTPGAPAIPEPSAWLMMLLGFAAVGGTIRRTRRTAMQVSYS